MIDYLLGQAPLGQGQGGAVAGPDRHIGPPYYLVNDTFTTDRAAGSVNGTNAEPGPGVRSVVDTGNRLAISGGTLAASAGGVNGDPKIFYSALSRAAGRIVVAKMMAVGAGTVARVQLGMLNEPGGSVISSLGLGGSGAIRAVLAGFSPFTVGSYSVDTAYVSALIVRDIGYFFLMKISSHWLLLWHGGYTSADVIYPSVSAFSSGIWSSDYIRVPATRWLPTPLASDGFSAWGTTDGLGHAEGIAGGLGSGGSGEAWTDAIGDWGAASGTASASALDGGIAVATVDTSTADVIATVEVTRSGGVAGCVLRYADADNYVRAVHTGTNAQLIKRVGGSETTLVNTAATYVAGAEIRVICEGTKFRLYYNNVFIGSEQTISDASLASGTAQGLYTTDTGNTFDDFIVYARGSGGEYAALDDV